MFIAILSIYFSILKKRLVRLLWEMLNTYLTFHCDFAHDVGEACCSFLRQSMNFTLQYCRANIIAICFKKANEKKNQTFYLVQNLL